VEKNLFAEGSLRVADFILNLPFYLLGNTFLLQVGMVCHLASLFRNLALYFVNLACHFILNAWLHPAGSCAEIRLAAEGENTLRAYRSEVRRCLLVCGRRSADTTLVAKRAGECPVPDTFGV